MSSFDKSSLFPVPEEDSGVTGQEEHPVQTERESGSPLLWIPVGGTGSRVPVEEIIWRIREDAENAKNRFQFLMIDTDGETGAEPDTEPDGEEA